MESIPGLWWEVIEQTQMLSVCGAGKCHCYFGRMRLGEPGRAALTVLDPETAPKAALAWKVLTPSQPGLGTWRYCLALSSTLCILKQLLRSLILGWGPGCAQVQFCCCLGFGQNVINAGLWRRRLLCPWEPEERVWRQDQLLYCLGFLL